MAFEFSLSKTRQFSIGHDDTKMVEVSDFFDAPDDIFSSAVDKTFAHINPHYPGIRAPVEAALLESLCESVSQMAAEVLSPASGRWEGQAWYSIVTQAPERLTPIQCLPHFDGFDEDQLAVMIYLNRTDHGGTGFYRHRSTGFERVTQARYPAYKCGLEQDVRQAGLPQAAYPTDGAPHFEKIYESDAAFNSLILYPGTILHSGVIRNDRPLPPEPAEGRLTINGFFRPR
ncbi:MAG: DUF6445 family protein [Pseudomonadota bacterium]